MKNLLLGLVLLIGMIGKSNAQSISVESTQYFEFYSDYWINLHHFFYQKAEGGQLRNLEEDGFSFLDIGEEDVIQSLNDEELQKYTKVIEYYKTHVIDRSLFELRFERVWLQEQNPGAAISDTSFSQAFTDILNLASEVYQPKFWPIHHSHNLELLDSQIELIKDMESEVVRRVEVISGDIWPETKVRVDLTAYANWAGAYTPTRPRMNIFISTVDPLGTGTPFIETIFHEGTHLLFTRESPFRANIFFKSEELGMEFPNNLWHAAQFYLAGLIVQNEFQQRGMEHEILMDTKNIFPDYDNLEFRRILDAYYLGEVGMDATIEALLKNLD